MADFNAALSYLMDDEDRQRSGAVVPDPAANDKTAKARFGINSAAHPEAVADGFYEMPKASALLYASNIYKLSYWVPIGGYQIICQDIANKFLSLAVNEGTHQATKIVQRALNQLFAPVVKGPLPLTVDGTCGPQTVAAINKANPEELLPAIKSYACQFLQDAAFRNKWPQSELDELKARVNR